MSGSVLRYTDIDLQPVSDEDRRKAALTVCDKVQDASLARELLAMLGLDDL